MLPDLDGSLTTDVGYGSLADITAHSRHVRFTPDSGHSSVQVGCLLCATSGHCAEADARGRRRQSHGKVWLGIGTGLKPPTGHRRNSAEVAFQHLRHRSSSYSSRFSWWPPCCRQLRTSFRLRAGPQERLTWLEVLASSPVSVSVLPRVNCRGLVLVQKPAEPLDERVLVDLAVLNDACKSARLVQLIHAGQLDDAVTELPQALRGGRGVLENALDVGIRSCACPRDRKSGPGRRGLRIVCRPVPRANATRRGSTRKLSRFTGRSTVPAPVMPNERSHKMQIIRGRFSLSDLRASAK